MLEKATKPTLTAADLSVEISSDVMESLFQNKVNEIAQEPEYTWGRDFKSFMTDRNGNPVVRVGIANCDLDTDIWDGLRSPANVGMFPLVPGDIWMHHAASSIQTTRYDGSPNPLAMPESFEEAKEHLKRVVIIGVMLAVNPEIYEEYARMIENGEEGPYDYYSRAVNKEVGGIVDKAVAKSSLSLMGPGRAIVPMTNRNADRIIERTRSNYTTGRYHGPCNNHWPQNSIAVLTGLLKFGVSRIPFRDEVNEEGKPIRLFGRYRSIVLFDEEDIVTDNSNGVSLISPENISRLRKVNDYTNTDDEIVSSRFCAYNMTKKDGSSVCGKCLEVCPSNALPNSSPSPQGVFSDRLVGQTHRFSGNSLDFDFGNCLRYRNQKADVFEEFVCARCAVICAARGVRKSAKALEKM